MTQRSITGRRVGLIGLGAMGSGMAGSLRRAGADVHVCDARDGVAAAFAAQGGTACKTPAELAARCEVVVSVVVNAAQTETTTSQRAASSAGVLHAVPPCAAKAAATPSRASQTWTSAPARRNDPAMPDPIAPRPIKPTRRPAIDRSVIARPLDASGS